MQVNCEARVRDSSGILCAQRKDIADSLPMSADRPNPRNEGHAQK